MLSIAKEKYPQFKYFALDLLSDDHPTKGETFDAVVSSAVMQHMPINLIPKALKNLQSLVCSNGYLLLRWFGMNIKPVVCEETYNGFNYVRYTTQALEALLKKEISGEYIESCAGSEAYSNDVLITLHKIY
jgi:phospholipid N-methyltransferase